MPLFFSSQAVLCVILCHFPRGNPLSILASVTRQISRSSQHWAQLIILQLPTTRVGGRIQEDALLKATWWSHPVHAPPLNLQGPLVISRPSRTEPGAHPSMTAWCFPVTHSPGGSPRPGMQPQPCSGIALQSITPRMMRTVTGTIR